MKRGKFEKLKVAILLEIAPELDVTSGTARVDNLPFLDPKQTQIDGANQTHRVIIGKDAFELGNDAKTTAAHELGHVLAEVFKMPEALSDPRVKRKMHDGRERTPGEADAMFNSERIAWKMAKDIFPELDDQQRAFAMMSYEFARFKANLLDPNDKELLEDLIHESVGRMQHRERTLKRAAEMLKKVSAISGDDPRISKNVSNEEIETILDSIDSLITKIDGEKRAEIIPEPA